MYAHESIQNFTEQYIWYTYLDNLMRNIFPYFRQILMLNQNSLIVSGEKRLFPTDII